MKKTTSLALSAWLDNKSQAFLLESLLQPAEVFRIQSPSNGRLYVLSGEPPTPSHASPREASMK